MTSQIKIFDEIKSNLKELSASTISESEVWLLRFIAVVAFTVQFFWTIFFEGIVPGFTMSIFQYLINSICLAAVIYSFAARLNERSAEYTKLLVSLSILAHSFYTTFSHSLHFSEILGSILTILVSYTLFKTHFSVITFSIAVIAMIGPFFGYENTSFVPTELAILLWGCLASISACSASMKIFNSDKARRQEAILFQTGKLKALGEMAAGIGHEINNPLAIINAKVTLLKQLTLKSQQVDSTLVQQHLDKMETTIHRIAKIVKTMRNFSRSDSREPYEARSVQQLIEETCSMCKETLSDEKILLKIDCPQDFSIFCNPTQIEQVLMNLIQNARDAVKNQTEKWIQLQVLEKPTSIEILCTDSGSRIPDEVAEKMMQPFFTTKEIGQGTGLGLSISRTIMNHHKGSLDLNRSHPNTQFKLTLPKHQIQESA